MKKILSILVIIFFWFNNTLAEIVDLEKCMVVDDDRNIVWTEERYNKLNTYILIPKDLFKQNYKNWGLVLDGKDYWKRIIQKTDGNLISVSPYKKYPQKFFDAVKSYNFKKVQLRSKNIYSINTNSGFITHLKVLTDEGVDLQKAQYLNDGDTFSFMYKKNTIEKLYIDTYLNTNIIAHRYYDFYTDVSQINRKQPIVIDLEKSLITEEFSSGHITKTICKPLSFSSDDTQEAKSSSGSAFFINNNGNLLTNNHVVDGCKSLSIVYKNKEHKAKLIAKDKTLDLALLKAEVSPQTFINFSNYNPKKLQTIYVAGYPFGKGLSDDLKISSGIISSLKGLQDNSNELQIDAAINKGNSGGPIVGEGGELIAIAVSGLGKEMSEGINFGIKSSAVLNFLGANNIDPSRANRTTLNKDKLLKILEESTLFISCIY
jgi:S1-C subfamily serine protease